jgi:hypothetical protein
MPDETVGILVETRANTAGLVDVHGRLLELTTDVEKNTAATEENVVAQEQEAEALNAVTFSSRRAQSAFVGVAFAVDAFTRSTAAGEGALRRTLRAIDMLAFSLGPEFGIPITIATGFLDSMFHAYEESGKAAIKAAEANAKFSQSLKDLWDQNSSGFETAFRQRGAYIDQLQLLQTQQRMLFAQVVAFDTLMAGKETLWGVPGTGWVLRLFGGKQASEDLAKKSKEIADVTEQMKKFEVVYQHILEETTGVEALKTAKLAAEAEKQRQKEILEAVKQRIHDVREAEKQAEEARKAELLTQKSEASAIAASQLTATTELWTKSVLGGLGLGPQAGPVVDTKALQAQLDALKGGTGFAKGLHEGFAGVDDDMKGFSESLGVIVGQQMPAFEDGLVQVFATLGRGGNVFKAFAQVAIGAIADVAAKMAASEFAQGLAMLARSIWDFFGPNPIAGASAAQHFAAAAAFGVIAGIAGSFGGAGGGGGGGSSGGYPGSFIPSSVGQPGGGVTVIVQTVDPWSRSVVNNTVYEINRAGMLNTPVIAPYARPS